MTNKEMMKKVLLAMAFALMSVAGYSQDVSRLRVVTLSRMP